MTSMIAFSNSDTTSPPTSLGDRLADLSFPTYSEKWAAIVQRNPLANNKFLYAVLTTKVFCRPTCPARLPRRSNVLFFATALAAQTAGFRACLRCRPLSSTTASAKLVEKACQNIKLGGKPSLDDLARESGLSKFHFQRVFKGITGISPQQYKMAHRDMIKERIADKVVFAVGPCYLGHILVGISERGICAITLGDDPDLLIQNLQNRYPKATMSPDNPDFNGLVSILSGAAESHRVNEWELPLDIQGTAFQHRVWNSLRQIPWGQMRSYSDIAKSIGSPAGVRAVASACAANPLAIGIPCHRVIRSDDGIGGYRWGVERKRALWEMEKMDCEDVGREELEKWVETCLNTICQ